jgi:UrcA family protein
MNITLSVIKAGIGSIGSHIQPSRRLLDAVRVHCGEYLSPTRKLRLIATAAAIKNDPVRQTTEGIEMNRQFTHRLAIVTGFTIAMGTIGAAALAQQPGETQRIIDEIRVEAPRMVHTERLPRGRGQQVSLAYQVTFADLDLTRSADVRELESRISTAANEICGQLETLFPLGDPSAGDCARRATEVAMTDVRSAVDAAVASR